MASSQLTYPSFLRRMNSLGRFGSKPGLARIHKLLDALDHPEKNYKCVLVAGTNGKGSTTAFLASALAAPRPGHRRPRIGSYYSPHLFSFCERIQVNGKNISKPALLSAARPVLALLPSLRSDPPTFFEVATAIALLHFSRAGVDYVVLEVGLGGRLDATNAVEPILCVITSIGLEHADILGRTPFAIAREKAGILRKGVPVVCAVRDKAALAAIRAQAQKIQAPLHLVRAPFSGPLRSPGSFQPLNAATAQAAARLLGLPPAIAARAISRTVIAGRWQTISQRPRTVIDCAHNPPAIEKIQPDLARDFKPKISSPRVLLFAAMADKDYAKMLRHLAPHFDFVVLCRPPFARAAKLSKLKKVAEKIMPGPKTHAISNPSVALLHAKKRAGPSGRVLVAGSIYLLAALFGEKEFKIAG